jgi:murein DD-endopeptidase MepM/ murein hydrolase activator NlpD
MCRVNPSICVPLAPADEASSTHNAMHEWAGRIASGGVSAPAQRVTMGGGPLADAAPLVLPETHAGSYAGQIKGSLRNAWTAAGLPADLASQVNRIFAGRLDATKPAQAGDSYRIVYEQDGRDQSGAPRRRVSALEIRLAGQTYRAVWFVAPGCPSGDYYSFDGERLIAQPFAMPVNYARISSPFGYRIHPVTGLRLLHTGVDLAAAVGTPVVAAAAGVVQFVGFDSGYGNHVVLRHAQGYTSYYAHLSSYANGLRVGAHVSQGQRLGAVGQTGVATGPHLHFEVRVNNRPTDPLTLTSRTGATLLAGRQRAAFDRVAGEAREQLAALSTSTDMRTASNTPPVRF